MAYKLGSVAAAMLASTGVASMTDAPIQHVSHSVLYDSETQQVLMSVTFDRPPDFYTVDQFDRQKDYFQFYIESDPNHYSPAGPWERIVRGSEIHVAGDVRVRDAWPPVPDSSWGPIEGAVPYILLGNTVSFAIPFWLADTRTGWFAYNLQVGSFGAGTTVANNEASLPVPGPGALATIVLSWNCAGGRCRRAERGPSRLVRCAIAP